MKVWFYTVQAVLLLMFFLILLINFICYCLIFFTSFIGFIFIDVSFCSLFSNSLNVTAAQSPVKHFESCQTNKV